MVFHGIEHLFLKGEQDNFVLPLLLIVLFRSSCFWHSIFFCIPCTLCVCSYYVWFIRGVINNYPFILKRMVDSLIVRYLHHLKKYFFISFFVVHSQKRQKLRCPSLSMSIHPMFTRFIILTLTKK